jgi:hypothetical protein
MCIRKRAQREEVRLVNYAVIGNVTPVAIVKGG